MTSFRSFQFIFLGSMFAVAIFFFMLFVQQESPSTHTSPTPELVTVISKDNTRKATVSFLNKFGDSAGEKLIDFASFSVRQIQFVLEFFHKNKKHSLNVFLQGTNTVPRFVACLADDEAASREVLEKGDMELPTRKLFQFLLQEKCINADGSRNLVLDAGANLGYFSTYSAVLGCRVLAFEAQPRLIPIIETSFKVNSVQERAKVVNNIVTTDPNARLKINYSKGMCWGCSHVSEAGPNDVENANVDIINATRIDSHAEDDVLLFKVDVEGYEVLAIESASKILENYNVKNILVEWNPRRFPHDIEKGNILLQRLCDQGFKIRHYDLRMEIPKPLWTKEETFDGIGKTWLIPKESIAGVNEFLKTQGYGEANFWLSKEY